MGEAANPGAKALVAQDATEEEERLQAVGAGASRGGQLDQRTRHRQGARQVPAPPHQNVCVQQFRQEITQRDGDEGNFILRLIVIDKLSEQNSINKQSRCFNNDSRIRSIRKGWVTVLMQ